MASRKRFVLGFIAVAIQSISAFYLGAFAGAETKADEPPAYDVKEHYTKYEYRIPMRDGVRLFTVVYVPKDAAKKYPFLVNRTPYGVGTRFGDSKEYGEDYYPANGHRLGPSEDFDRAGYIFVDQDVRGRFMSEGHWLEMTPHREGKKSPADVDESSDMHDTVEWLLKNVPGNNGNVGIWGISYPGFYTAASIIDSHPAIKAASPQAPIIDLFMGDDSYHGGAFMLSANFDFYAVYRPQQNPTAEPRKWEDYEYGQADAYDFFLGLGTLAQVAKTLPADTLPYWNDQYQHDIYDEYWKPRALTPHLKNIHCAVLSVGGWFDAEDLQGPLTIFRAVGQENPAIFNGLVMGPWVHGGWIGAPGHKLGQVDFAADTAEYFRQDLMLPFFEHYLKGTEDGGLAKVNVFETGTNLWRRYDRWPPANTQARMLYFQPAGGLSWEAPTAPAAETCDHYVSDPAHPVPYIGYPATGVPQEYMVSDQRFAAKRSDVLVYRTPPLEEDLTIAGPVSPKLIVSTAGTDSDFVVKLIDEYPANYPDDTDKEESSKKDVGPPSALPLAGYEQLVRGEPFRGKFRHSFEKPEPFEPGKATEVDFTMPDIDHTFRRGHRIMVQVQSSWFPLIDRNPQTFLHIPDARPEDFKPATECIYRSAAQPSGIELPVLPQPEADAR
jgi:putative CocE/NonD family hydrolase